MPTARLRNDPYKYIRVVKGGRYQARPWDDGERFNLGLFPTRDAAAIAIREFWQHGGASWYRKAKMKYVRPKKRRDGTSAYTAVVFVNLGDYTTEESAYQAIRKYLQGTCGIFADAVLKRG